MLRSRKIDGITKPLRTYRPGFTTYDTNFGGSSYFRLTTGNSSVASPRGPSLTGHWANLASQLHWSPMLHVPFVPGLQCVHGTFHDFRWFSMIFDDFRWFSMIFDDFWWFLMIFDGIWWDLMGFDGIWWDSPYDNWDLSTSTTQRATRAASATRVTQDGIRPTPSLGDDPMVGSIFETKLHQNMFPL